MSESGNNIVMKKMFFTFIFVFFTSVLLYSQETEANSYFTQFADSSRIENHTKSIQYHTNIGSSFFYSKAFGSGTEFYVAPELSYGLTPRLSFHGGLMFSSTSFFGPSNDMEAGPSTMMAIPGLSLYGAANYQLNEKLSFYGTGIRHMSNFFPIDNNGINIQPQYSYSFGSSYKIGNNITIGASIQVNDRVPYYSPLSSPGIGGHYSPFDW